MTLYQWIIIIIINDILNYIEYTYFKMSLWQF